MKCLNFVGILLLYTSSCLARSSLTYLVEFDNKSDLDYVVYERAGSTTVIGGPVFASPLIGWKPILVLRAHQKGVKEVLIRDSEAFGVQLKLDPQVTEGQPIYISGGIKQSGDCVQMWYEGPFAFNITLEENVLDNIFQSYQKVKRVRYCSNRKAEGVVEIYPDGVAFKSSHNMKILDQEKVLFTDFKK